jgi:chromosome partitioning protein
MKATKSNSRVPIVVAFVSQKGGVGKSTLARGLAAVASRGRLQVLLADLDTRQQAAVRWHKARRRKQKTSALEVAAFATPDDALAACGKAELLIFDAPGHSGPETVDLAKRAHLVVLPTGPSFDDLHPTVLLLHDLMQARVPRDRLIVALCRVLESGEDEAAREYIDSTGFEIAPGSIPERAAYRDAQNRGHAVTETSEPALNQRANARIEALLRRVLRQLQNGTAQASRDGQPTA